MYYLEWASKPYTRHGTMVPVTALPRILRQYNPGYRSVYMFDENAAMEIRDKRNSKGFKQYPVHSDTLFIDLDDGDTHLAAMEQAVNDFGVGYEVWESGGKGYHLVIPTELQSGQNVPYSQEVFVQQLGVPVDTSLYRHNSLISLPGRVHPETKRKKKLVKAREGDRKLQIEQKDPPPSTKLPVSPSFKDEDELAIGLTQLLSILHVEPKPGNRHRTIWSTALNFADAGISMETATELIMTVNELWQKPKSHEEVMRAIRQAFLAN